MIQAKGYAVQSAESKFEPFSFERRELGAKDILIEIQYCGICHSDIHRRETNGITRFQQIEVAYERTVKSDVRYRFVIDMQSL